MKWPEAPTDYGLGDDHYGHGVERPETIGELCEVVAARMAAGDALYPQGGRTALDFGGAPARPGVVVDITGLDAVVDYPAADMTATVQAGMTLGCLQEVLARENQWLTLDAPLPARATLGGIFATNTAGPRRFGHGRPRDQIIGVGFVTSEGKLIRGGGRVVKNVAGYDFPKLLTGSMGTLGILSEMTLRVRPRPETRAMLPTSWSNLEAVDEALAALNGSSTRPTVVELLDARAARSIDGVNASDDRWRIMVGFEGNPDAVAWQVGRLREELVPLGASDILSLEEPDPWGVLADLPEILRGRLSLRANLPASAVVPFCDLLGGGRWTVHAHAGSGVVWAHLSEASEQLNDLLPEIDQLRRFAVGRGGNLVLPVCPSAWKERLRVWGEPRPEWRLMADPQRALDPAHVMNPGRFEAIV